MAVINKMINNVIRQEDIPQAYWHDYGGGGVHQAYSDSDDDDDALMFSRGSRGPSSVRPAFSGPAAPVEAFSGPDAPVEAFSELAASAFSSGGAVVAMVADSLLTAVRTVISGPAAPVEDFSEPVASGSDFTLQEIVDYVESDAVSGFNPTGVTSYSDYGDDAVSYMLFHTDDDEEEGGGDNDTPYTFTDSPYTLNQLLDHAMSPSPTDDDAYSLEEGEGWATADEDEEEGGDLKYDAVSDTVSGYGDEEDELTSDIADSASEEEWTTTDADEEEGGDFQYDATKKEAIEWAERQSDPEIAALVTKEAIEKEAIAAMVTASMERPGQQGFVDHTQAVDRLTGALGGMGDRDKAEVMEYLSRIHGADLAALVSSPAEFSIQAPLIRSALRKNDIMRGLRQREELMGILTRVAAKATDHEKAGMTSNPLDVVQRLQSAMGEFDQETRRNVMAALNDKMKLGDFDKIMARGDLSDVLLGSLLPAPLA